MADGTNKNTSASYAMVRDLKPIKVFCDLESDPFDGWTVIMQRINMDVDFNRTWREYKSGFGKMEKGQDFWLGRWIKIIKIVDWFFIKKLTPLVRIKLAEPLSSQTEPHEAWFPKDFFFTMMSFQ